MADQRAANSRASSDAEVSSTPTLSSVSTSSVRSPRRSAVTSAVARASGNHRLTRLVERMVDETVRLFAPGFHMGEHREIIDALRAGDGERARLAAMNHILMTQERALKQETTGFPSARRFP